MQSRLKMLRVVFLSSVVMLAACSKSVQQVSEDIRPVRTMKMEAQATQLAAEFSGEVRPRIESHLGFRVAGKILTRKVDVGTVVHVGQVLAQIDPQDLALAQISSKAALDAAKADLDAARSDLKRYAELRDKGFIGAAELERHQNSFASSQSKYDQAIASLKVQGNQTGYANLLADANGVVTGVDAEVGQVVSAGQSVIRVAQTAEKEVVIGIPEDRVVDLRALHDVKVSVWAHPEQNFAGHVREISPAADPATRTYTVKISLPNPPEFVLLGMTANVTFETASPTALMRLPLTALVHNVQADSVWVVDPATMTVKLTPVRLSGPLGNDVLIAGGLQPGQIVVTAGANLLQPDQKVKLLNDGIGQTVSAAEQPAQTAQPVAGAAQ